MVSRRDEAIRFEKYFEHAQGWLALGKVDEAALALEQIPGSYKSHPRVTAFRCELHMVAKNWDLAAMLAQRLVEIEPGEAQNWVHWAYAERRLKSIGAAEEILRRARKLHPDCAIIPFNLACYAAQTDRCDEVEELLRSAVQIDPTLEQAAREDPDLKPYWSSGRASPGPEHPV
jgi:Flp pilus assembly protein TadD